MNAISAKKKQAIEGVIRGLKTFDEQPIQVRIDIPKEIERSNNAKYVTKDEIEFNFGQLVDKYKQQIKSITTDVALSEKQLTNRIEKVNFVLLRELEKSVKDLRLADASTAEELSSFITNASKEIESVRRPLLELVDKSEARYVLLENAIQSLIKKVSDIDIPKNIKLVEGDNVKIKKEENGNEVKYTISTERGTIGRFGGPLSYIGNDIIRRIYAGDNISVSSPDSSQGVTISSLGNGGSTIFAGTGINVNGQTVSNTLPGVSNQSGFGIDINGLTITNTLPGVSIQAGDNISIFGLTISATTPSGVSNQAGLGINITGLTITNTLPGVSMKAGEGIDVSGLTITNTLPGVSLQAGPGINISGLTVNNIDAGTSAVNTHVLQGNPHTQYVLKTGDTVTGFLHIVDGAFSMGSTSSTETSPIKFAPASQTPINIYQRSTDLTIGTGTGTNNRMLNISLTASSGQMQVFGVAGLIFPADTTGAAALGRVNNRWNTFSSNLGVGSSVLLNALGASGIVRSGHSGLLYGTTTIDYSELTGTPVIPTDSDQITEGNSNFYYLPNRFVGIGGVSVSVTGKTVTIFGLSSALNTNQVSEGTSNFYWRVDRIVAGSGVSVIRNGVTATIQATASASAGGVSGQLQYNSGSAISGLSFFSFFEDTDNVQSGLMFGRDGFDGLVRIVGNGIDISSNDDDLPDEHEGRYLYASAGSGGPVSGSGGNIEFAAGSAGGNGDGGDMVFDAGLKAGTGRHGRIVLGTRSGQYLFSSTNPSFMGFLDFSLISGTSRTYLYPDASGRLTLVTSFSGTAGASVSVNGSTVSIGINRSGVSSQFLNGIGTYESPLQSKSIYIEGPTATDFIPFFRVEQSMALEKVVYDISGGTQWVGQIQRWNSALGASRFDTQLSDRGVTTTAVGISFTGVSFLSGEYMALKGSSVAGGISWLLVNVYFRNN